MPSRSHARIACVLLAVLALAGCASANLNAPPVPIASTASLTGARLALVVPESPDFLAITPPGWKDAAAGAVGGMVGGAIGGVARASSIRSEGVRMAKEFGLTDPALATGQGLAARLRASYRMSDAPAVSALPVAESVDAVLAAAPEADLVLDVRSQVYGFNYTPKVPTNFFVMNTTWARLIDVRTRAVLAQARCIPLKLPPVQTFDQLVANNGEVIKSELANYVQPCIAQLAEKMKL